MIFNEFDSRSHRELSTTTSWQNPLPLQSLEKNSSTSAYQVTWEVNLLQFLGTGEKTIAKQRLQALR